MHLPLFQGITLVQGQIALQSGRRLQRATEATQKLSTSLRGIWEESCVPARRNSLAPSTAFTSKACQGVTCCTAGIFTFSLLYTTVLQPWPEKRTWASHILTLLQDGQASPRNLDPSMEKKDSQRFTPWNAAKLLLENFEGNDVKDTTSAGLSLDC